jgi:hypothetical protein
MPNVFLKQIILSMCVDNPNKLCPFNFPTSNSPNGFRLQEKTGHNRQLIIWSLNCCARQPLNYWLCGWLQCLAEEVYSFSALFLGGGGVGGAKICAMYLSEFIVLEQKICPISIFAPPAHHTPTLMPCKRSLLMPCKRRLYISLVFYDKQYVLCYLCGHSSKTMPPSVK